MSSKGVQSRVDSSEEKGLALELLTSPTLSTAVEKHPMTWSSLAAEEFLVQLRDEHLHEIDLALNEFKKLQLDGDEVDSEKFSLPTLKPDLDTVAAKVHNGCGLGVLRGVDPSRYSHEDILTVFLAVADFIGDVRGVQNKRGDVITHITDARQWTAPYAMRHGIHTNATLPFHNDMGADILALQVRQCAKEGGHTYVASAGKVFCELVKSRPDVVETLFRADWPIQVSSCPSRCSRVPLLQWHNGNIMISLDPGRLGLHPTMARHFGGEVVPSLTPTQQEALEALSTVATEHRFRLDTQPGDIVFINNWALLHARSSYTDCDLDCGPRRHLVRLWLRNSTLGWAVPAGMRVQWEAAYGPDGMGDKTYRYGNKSEYRGSRTTIRNYPVNPAPVYKLPKYTSASAAFVIEDSDDDGD